MHSQEKLLDFINQEANQRKTNKLDPYLEQIAFLKSKNMSIRQIHKYLTEVESVDVSTKTINRFINTKLKDHLEQNDKTFNYDLEEMKKRVEGEFVKMPDNLVLEEFKKWVKDYKS